MRQILSSFIGAGVLIGGCSTVSVNSTPNILQRFPVMEEILPGKDLESVDLFLEKRLKEQPDESMEWWVRYHQGKIWSKDRPARSCERFTALAKSEEFPLAKIANLRALDVCAVDDAKLPPLETVLNTTTEPWLKTLLHQTILDRSIKTADLALEMRMSAEVAKQATLQSEKIRLLTRAITLSKILHQDNLTPEYEASLAAVAPRFRTKPEPREFLDVAFDLRKARKFDDARAYYQKVLTEPKLDDASRYRALDGIRLAYKLEKRVDDYVNATQEMAEFTRRRFKQASSDKFWLEKFHDSQVQLARTLWTERGANDAMKVLGRLEKDIRGRRPLDEVRWLRARIAEEAGRFESAVQILGQAASRATRDNPLFEKIAWYHAWNLYKLGRNQEANDAFKRLDVRFATNTNSPRNHFWLAKTLRKLGREDEATRAFETLISDDPLGYYGVLAYRELGRDLPAAKPMERGPASLPGAVDESQPREIASASNSEQGPFVEPRDQAYVEWLLAVGESDIARLYLNQFSASRAISRDVASERELLLYHARAGNFQGLFTRLYKYPSEIRQKMIDEDPALLFPQPYFHYVSQAGRHFGVTPELIYAIMRQESSFDPHARSPADAFGLMQLIPEAAHRVEGAAGFKIASAEDLYKPDVNVTLGAAFLRNLLDQTGEQFILTVASYNASEKAIRGWLKTRYRGDALEFIEDIPYEETRAYVKLVLRNYVFYLRLNSGGHPVPFPEWCLQNLHDFSS